jgi:hypothetical protein
MAKATRPTGLLLICILLPLWTLLPPLLTVSNPIAPYLEGFRWSFLGDALLLVGSVGFFLGRRWGWSLALVGLLANAIPATMGLLALLSSDGKADPFLPFAEGFRLGGWLLMFAWLWMPGVQSHTRRD